MSAFDPPGLSQHIPTPSGHKTYNVEVFVTYRRTLEIAAVDPEHAEEKAIQHLEEMAPSLIEDAQIVCCVQ
jgi:hypothetical protein